MVEYWISVNQSDPQVGSYLTIVLAVSNLAAQSSLIANAQNKKLGAANLQPTSTLTANAQDKKLWKATSSLTSLAAWNYINTNTNWESPSVNAWSLSNLTPNGTGGLLVSTSLGYATYQQPSAPTPIHLHYQFITSSTTDLTQHGVMWACDNFLPNTQNYYYFSIYTDGPGTSYYYSGHCVNGVQSNTDGQVFSADFFGLLIDVDVLMVGSALTVQIHDQSGNYVGAGGGWTTTPTALAVSLTDTTFANKGGYCGIAGSDPNVVIYTLSAVAGSPNPAGVVAHHASANLVGISAITIAGNTTHRATSMLLCGSLYRATANKTAGGKALLTSTSILQGTGSRIAGGKALLTSTSILQGTGSRIAGGKALLTSTSILQGAGVMTRGGKALLASTSILQGAGSRIAGGKVLLTYNSVIQGARCDDSWR